MKSIIKRILLEDTHTTDTAIDISKSEYLPLARNRKLNMAVGKMVNKWLEENKYEDIAQVRGFEFNSLQKFIRKLFHFEYSETNFVLFKHIVDLKEDPNEIWDFEEFIYKCPDWEVINFLKLSGYYERFIYDHETVFTDIEKNEDGELIFVIDEWVDLEDWFDEPGFMNNVMGDDWVELFYTEWHYIDLEDILKNLPDNGIQLIVDHIMNDYDYIEGLGHREEFNEHGMDIVEDGDIINVKKHERTLRSHLHDRYLLQIFIGDSELYHSDLHNDLNRSYNDAYNSIAMDYAYKEIKGTIQDFLGSEAVRGDDDRIYFKLTQDKFTEWIDRFIVLTDEQPYDEWNQFKNFMDDLFKHIPDLEVPDMDHWYPDSDKLGKYIEESLHNYL
jgi:hypothetical protein